MTVNESHQGKRTLLLVDDEENILRALTRLLRRDNYHILTANSGQAGLALLKENPVGVIISDQRMPEMSGIEFLSKAKELYPDTIRIVLSGFTELNSVTEAINQGAIYKFLTKPWDDNLLRKNIEEAFHHSELLCENIRLGKELIRVNEKLRLANKKLTSDVKVNRRVADVSMQALQIEQEVLENIPVGVIGIGNDGIIAVANMKAHELIQPVNGCLIGCSAQETLGEELYHKVIGAFDKEAIHVREINNKEVKCNIHVKRMGATPNITGVVMVIIPDSQT